MTPSTDEWLDKILETHRVKWLSMLDRLNDELITVPEMLQQKAEIIAEAKQSILSHFRAKELEGRIAELELLDKEQYEATIRNTNPKTKMMRWYSMEGWAVPTSAISERLAQLQQQQHKGEE